MTFETISRYISDQTSEAINLMKNLIPIKSMGPLNNGDGESDKAEFLLSYLKANGFTDISEYPSSDPSVKGGVRPNIIARIPGKNKNKTVWIMSHLDIVPAGDIKQWKTNPFEAHVEDGKIYGRGAEDNTQGMVSSLITAKAFLDKGIIPNYNIALLFVSDEETGSKHGLHYIVENYRDLFKEDDLLIVPDAGEKDGSMIVVAEKSILWVKFRTTGVQVHASLPGKGHNAFSAASQLVVSLGELYEIFDGKNNVFDPPVSTFEPTKKEQNVYNINTIPGEDVFYMDCRILPRYSIESVLKEIKRICSVVEKNYGVRIEIIVEQEDQAAPATSVDADVVKALKAGISEVYKINARAMGIGGGTVAAIFRRSGLNAAVWSTLDDKAHQPNEYCVIANIINDAKVFAHVCLQDKWK